MRTRDEQKEQAIREKALEMVVKTGFDGLSMQRLAKAAKVSPATIYIYFKDREDLILQIYLEVNERLTRSMLENFDSSMNFEEGMKVQWLNRARYFMEHPLEVQFLEQIKHSPFYEKALPLEKTDFRKKMKEFISKAIADKELKALPFEVYWSIAYAPLYQLVKYHLQGKSHLNENFSMSDDILFQTLSLVLQALKPLPGLADKVGSFTDT